jgi:hypothetical protein
MTTPAETVAFLTALYRRSAGYLTLSAVRPGQATPSRHIALADTSALASGLHDLLAGNRRGWHAFYSVAPRQTDLGRWRRGGTANLHHLPALFADIDRPPAEVLPRLRDTHPSPSAVVLSGGGVHAYWWLTAPTVDWRTANAVLRGLAQHLDGDRTHVAGALRLPGSRNPKPGRDRCTLHTLTDHHYPLEAFPMPTPQVRDPPRLARSDTLNPRLLDAVSVRLLTHGGYLKPNGWIAAHCPAGHRRDHPGAHFAFNPRLGVGVCHGRHGCLLLRELCDHLHINPRDHGGIYSTQ